MTKLWAVAAAGGLAGLLGLTGLGAGRAQQAEPKGEAGVSQRKGLRDRLVKLRTEVEILQIEHDADRADLSESTTELRTLLRKGLGPDQVQGYWQMAMMLGGATDEQKKELIEALSRDMKENPEMAKELQDVGVVDLDPKALVKMFGDSDALTKLDAKVGERKLRALIDLKKKAFTRLAADLNEKKFDLEEAEQRYKQVR